ncbi:sugar phosphate isomerase/epimerase family protein [Pontiella agarivorans]|uniref:Sugar phosphate isomerase/epimerase n=1 Tax=Pontiella agarivorans TaxID=3038953 RepID=A0ABU5N0S8_9BACT|nr:sugar phosphate isomerase/epimerase family protein [Pontiella agarivorans]MDZ8120050.1 sugar phosphate isomerase/epimerase [Pontiella agarivorans]
MMKSIGLCTWSLKNNAALVFQTLEDAGLSCLHLDISALDGFREGIQQRNITVTSTMVGFPQEDYSTLESIRQTGGIIPNDCWERNRQIVLEAISATASLGVDYLSFHAGFIDHYDEKGFRTFCSRMTELADAAAENGVCLLLETGQETAEDLRYFLDEIEHPALGVNFDPANMILYGKGDPVQAVEVLAPWIRHVHIKDATAASVKGEWGVEVPWGDGDVDGDAFIGTLIKIGYSGALEIEREAGDSREEDIKLAAKRLGVSHGG